MNYVGRKKMMKKLIVVSNNLVITETRLNDRLRKTEGYKVQRKPNHFYFNRDLLKVGLYI